MNLDTLLAEAHVFPCNEKHLPTVKWGRGSKVGTDSFPKNKNGKWGVNCEMSGMFCVDIDVDPTRGKDGRKGFKALLKKHTGSEEMPNTFITRSKGGRGFHVWFEGKGPTTAGTLCEHVDTRGSGGAIFLGFKVVKDAPIATIPNWLQEWAGQHAEALPDRKTVVCAIEPDKPEYVEQATDWLINFAPPAIEGESGDHTTFTVAARIKDFGVSEESALELLVEYWNENNDPPWEIDDLAKKIANAYAYGQNDLGSATEEARDAEWTERYSAFDEFDGETTPKVEKTDDEDWGLFSSATEEESGKSEGDSSTLFRFTDLKPGEAPPRKWLIEGWIPEKAVSSVYGAPGVGKSLITLDLALSVAFGVPWFGLPASDPTPTLFVSCEDDQDEMHYRASALWKKPVHVPNLGKSAEFYCWDRVGADSILAAMTVVGAKRQKFLSQLKREIKNLAPEGKPRLLILDTFSDISSLNENDRGHVNYFIKFILGSIAVENNCTVVFLAHPSKSSDYSGSTAFGGSVRGQIFLDMVEGQQDMRLIRRGKSNRARCDGDGEGISIKWHDDYGTFDVIDAAEFEVELKAQQKRAVFNELRLASENGNGLKFSGNNPIKSHPFTDEQGCAIPYDTVKAICNVLIDEGSIDNVSGKGLVAVPDPF